MAFRPGHQREPVGRIRFPSRLNGGCNARSAVSRPKLGAVSNVGRVAPERHDLGVTQCPSSPSEYHPECQPERARAPHRSRGRSPRGKGAPTGASLSSTARFGRASHHFESEVLRATVWLPCDAHGQPATRPRHQPHGTEADYTISCCEKLRCCYGTSIGASTLKVVTGERGDNEGEPSLDASSRPDDDDVGYIQLAPVFNTEIFSSERRAARDGYADRTKNV